MQRPDQTTRARELRQAANPAERKAWYALRLHAKGKISIRRQHPAGPYYLDFYCAAAKLALELDGNSHDDRAEYDARRTTYLNQIGITVIRVPNTTTDTGQLDHLAAWFVEECLGRISERQA